MLRCDICSEDIPTALRGQHKDQHKTERQFARALEKGRVSKNKKVDESIRGDVNKKGKKSGYLTFCDTMRPILRERNKPAPKEMMALLGMQCSRNNNFNFSLSLLGSEWRKLSKEEQAEWNKKCLKETVADIPRQPVTQPHVLLQAAPQQQVHEGELNQIEAPENQSRISKCAICDKMMNTNKLQKHMEENHGEIEEELLEPECVIVQEEPEQVQVGPGQAEGEQEQAGEEPQQLEEGREMGEQAEQVKEGEKVVMVKRKTLWWPAEVMGKSNLKMTLKILNKKCTVIEATIENVKKFQVDHSQMAGMTREWRDAYLKAVDIVAEAAN